MVRKKDTLFSTNELKEEFLNLIFDKIYLLKFLQLLTLSLIVVSLFIYCISIVEVSVNKWLVGSNKNWLVQKMLKLFWIELRLPDRSLIWIRVKNWVMWTPGWDHAFSMNTNLSKRLSFRTTWYAHMYANIHKCAYHEISRNIFLEKFAYVLNGWSLDKRSNLLYTRWWKVLKDELKLSWNFNFRNLDYSNFQSIFA